jgi:hypothetical protein
MSHTSIQQRFFADHDGERCPAVSHLFQSDDEK